MFFTNDVNRFQLLHNEGCQSFPQAQLNLLELKGGQVQKMHFWEIEKNCFYLERMTYERPNQVQRKKDVPGSGMQKKKVSSEPQEQIDG